MAAILKYLTLWHDDVLEAFPAGKVPPVEEVTLRTAEGHGTLPARTAQRGLEDRSTACRASGRERKSRT